MSGELAAASGDGPEPADRSVSPQANKGNFIAAMQKARVIATAKNSTDLHDALDEILNAWNRVLLAPPSPIVGHRLPASDVSGPSDDPPCYICKRPNERARGYDDPNEAEACEACEREYHASRTDGPLGDLITAYGESTSRLKQRLADDVSGPTDDEVRYCPCGCGIQTWPVPTVDVSQDEGGKDERARTAGPPADRRVAAGRATGSGEAGDGDVRRGDEGSRSVLRVPGSEPGDGSGLTQHIASQLSQQGWEAWWGPSDDDKTAMQMTALVEAVLAVPHDTHSQDERDILLALAQLWREQLALGTTQGGGRRYNEHCYQHADARAMLKRLDALHVGSAVRDEDAVTLKAYKPHSQCPKCGGRLWPKRRTIVVCDDCGERFPMAPADNPSVADPESR